MAEPGKHYRDRDVLVDAIRDALKYAESAYADVSTGWERDAEVALERCARVLRRALTEAGS